MVGVPSAETAAERARWLADLAETLDDARALLVELSADKPLECLQLSADIESARNEVQTLRLFGSSGRPRGFDPEWMKNVPWELSA